jgi:hypothetical protein
LFAWKYLLPWLSLVYARAFFLSSLSCLFWAFVVYFLYSFCLFFGGVFMAKKGWQFFLGEDVVAELDEYAKEWGMTRSAALTMIIKTVVGGKKVINSEEENSDSVSSDLLSHA